MKLLFLQKCAREAKNPDGEERVDNVEGGKGQVFHSPIFTNTPIQTGDNQDDFA